MPMNGISSEQDDRLTLINRCPYFAGFSLLEKKSLADRLYEVCYASGDILIKQGEILDSIYFIVEGEVQLLRYDAAHQTKVLLETLKKGDTIGFDERRGMISNAIFPWHIVAVSPLRVFRLAFSDLNEVLENDRTSHIPIGNEF